MIIGVISDAHGRSQGWVLKEALRLFMQGMWASGCNKGPGGTPVYRSETPTGDMGASLHMTSLWKMELYVLHDIGS